MGKRLIRTAKGAAMVELAIIMPILLLVLFGIIELGLIMYNKAVITNASREGARTGIVFRANATTGVYEPYDVPYIEGVVNTYLDNGNRLIPSGPPTITVPSGPCIQTVPPAPNFSLRVMVTYSYNFLVLPVTWLTGPVNLAGETIMRCE
jgi:hypothetical protein